MNLYVIEEKEVFERLKKAKKKPSTVPGDINPKLYDLYPDILCKPITHIYNTIIQQHCWPDLWKREHITVIPKIPDPREPSDCRNIACTNFLSKVFEGFVLQWARQEVRPKSNQFGGEPGASAAHLLVQTMDYVTASLKDNRAGVILSALDFSKAFNRLDHGHCLNSLINRGASRQVINLLAAFLSEREMTVKVGKTRSKPRKINAGAPQGSVLGCFLFNMGIDDLEEGFSLGDNQEPLREETPTRSDDFPTASTPIRVDKGPTNMTFSLIAGNQQVAILP